MALINKNFNLTATTRQGVRQQLMNEFLQENAGTGKGQNCTYYDYIVENLPGYSITLCRPASLNKGFDFTVRTTGVKYDNSYTRKLKNGVTTIVQKIDDCPKHDNVKDILLNLKNTLQANQYTLIKTELTNIYSLQQYNLANVAGITFSDYIGTQRPIEIILLAIKWLFIEQDITYWNWSGRAMLWQDLQDAGLV